eukprot:16439530-Heterocapsa_arctica.AAC.1
MYGDCFVPTDADKGYASARCFKSRRSALCADKCIINDAANLQHEAEEQVMRDTVYIISKKRFGGCEACLCSFSWTNNKMCLLTVTCKVQNPHTREREREAERELVLSYSLAFRHPEVGSLKITQDNRYKAAAPDLRAKKNNNAAKELLSIV